MIFGEKSEFAIEAYHEPISNDGTHIFGRMCCWCQGEQLGDINEPSCILGVIVGILESVIARLPQLHNSELGSLSNFEVFNFLDHKLYEDDDRTLEQVTADSKAYGKFDFLTNGGESFDNSKSFIIAESSSVRILFYDYDRKKNVFTKFSKKSLLNGINNFIDWHSTEQSKLTNKDRSCEERTTILSNE